MKPLGRNKQHFLFVCELTLGNETFYRNLREGIESRGDVDATWIPIEYRPQEIVARLPPCSLNWSLRAAVVARARVNALIQSGRSFDAAFFHSQIPALFLSGFRKTTPTVFSMDATPIGLDTYGRSYQHRVGSTTSPIERIKHHLTRTTYHDAAFLIPWSQWAKASLINDYQIAEERIVVCSPGINLVKWNAVPSRSESDSAGRTRILFVGGDFIRKGGDLVVRLAAKPEFRDCEFHLVTKNYQGRMNDNIVVHRDLTPNSEVLAGLLRSSDVFVLPTRGDVFSVSVAEAMASGLPVVASDVGGIGEMIRNGETGFLIPPGEERLFGLKLLDLVRNAGLRQQLGRNAREYAEKNFSLSNNLAMIIRVLQKAALRRMG